MMSRIVEEGDALLVRRLMEAGSEGFLSGEDLSGELKISRTAVWKRIESLRKKGFDIESLKRKGYRFKPGATLPFSGALVLSELKTDFVARELYFYSETDSTNSRAMELARAGAVEGTAVIADSQTGGKGRLGRKWFSPKGTNLYTSIILRPPVAPREAPSMTLLFAVAVSEAIEAFTNALLVPTVKWPNDVLLGERKVAGVLTEMAAEMDRVEYVVCGVGVNLNMDTLKSETETGVRAASLKEAASSEIERARFTRELYYTLEKWYKIYLKDGIAPVTTAWRSYFAAEGKQIRVDAINRVVEGVCAGIDESGSLLVRASSGEIERITSGEMTLN